jgi:S1-C subfamily serine protease
MSRVSGRYLLLAALVCGAFVLALVWNRAPRTVPEPAHVPVGMPETAASAKLNQPSSERPTAGQSDPVAIPAVPDNVPDADQPPQEQALPPADARQLAKIAHGMRPNPAGGILVEATPPGSVVGQLRLQPGDVILSVDGVPATTPEQFALNYREQGLPRQLTILRNGTEFHLH